MMSQTNNNGVDDVPYLGLPADIAVLMCQSSKKEFYKKFLYEPLPVEVGQHLCFPGLIPRPL